MAILCFLKFFLVGPYFETYSKSSSSQTGQIRAITYNRKALKVYIDAASRRYDAGITSDYHEGPHNSDPYWVPPRLEHETQCIIQIKRSSVYVNVFLYSLGPFTLALGTMDKWRINVAILSGLMQNVFHSRHPFFLPLN